MIKKRKLFKNVRTNWVTLYVETWSLQINEQSLYEEQTIWKRALATELQLSGIAYPVI